MEASLRVGLCWSCRHARVVRTRRSIFWRCELSDTDPRFAKYPRLPVLQCDGFVPKEQEGAASEGGE